MIILPSLPSMRPLSLILMGLLALASTHGKAQGPKNIVLYGRCTAPISHEQEKQIQMLLGTADAAGLVSIHTDRHHVKVLHSTDLAEGAVASIFQLAGLDLHLLQGAPGPVSNKINGATGMPAYVDTGNPDLDAQNYAAAKVAWAEAHPLQYEELFGQ